MTDHLFGCPKTFPVKDNIELCFQLLLDGINVVYSGYPSFLVYTKHHKPLLSALRENTASHTTPKRIKCFLNGKLLAFSINNTIYNID